MTSVLRTDILPEDLKTKQPSFRFIAQSQFNSLLQTATRLERHQRSVGDSKNIVETMELIQDAIDDYQKRENKTSDAAIDIIYNRPDSERYVETISIELISRQPGEFGQNRAGRPSPGRNSGEVRNLKPLLREVLDDVNNPGYKRMVLGFYYDNVLRLTCWARTNKQALKRMLWLENVIQEYTWYFTYSGVNRLYPQGQTKDIVEVVNGNKYYGKPIDYFVKTEKIITVSEKTLEEITVNLSVTNS